MDQDAEILQIEHRCRVEFTKSKRNVRVVFNTSGFQYSFLIKRFGGGSIPPPPMEEEVDPRSSVTPKGIFRRRFARYPYSV